MAVKTLDNYTIEARIKQGGTGTVYRAKDSSTGESVALKVIDPRVASSRSLMRNVRREAKICMRLEHDTIVKVYELVRSGPSPYVVMEYCPGRDLKMLILNRLPDVKWHIREVARQIAGGLAYLHRNDIIHCDMKPNNVLVSPDWKVKIVDFALARLDMRGFSMVRSPFWTWVPSRPRREGTLEYLSPEQVNRRKLTKRTDVYALGATLYEAIAGAPPLVGRDPNEVMTKILSTRPKPLQESDRRISPDFDSLVMRMLSKDAAKRPPDAGAVLARLKNMAVFKDEHLERGM
jgi:serine/threonine protein kinase